MLDGLARAERLRLMKFVCSFAWADLKIRPQERDFVARLVERLGLNADEAAQVQGWLEVPPPPESVDPTEIPEQHRELFVSVLEDVVGSDDEVSDEERENLILLKQLLA